LHQYSLDNERPRKIASNLTKDTVSLAFNRVFSLYYMTIPDLRVNPTIKTSHASVCLNCVLRSYPWTFANNNGIPHKLCLPYFTSRYTYCLLIYYAPRSCGGSTTSQNFRRFHHPDVTSDAEWFKMLFLITVDGVIWKLTRKLSSALLVSKIFSKVGIYPCVYVALREAHLRVLS